MSKESFANVFVFVFGLLLDLHQPALTRERQFTKVAASSGYGSKRLARGWTVDSLTGCAFQCIAKYSSKCQTFMYNSNTGLCTPGSYLNSGVLGKALTPTTTEGDLYAQSSCDTSDDFSQLVASTGLLSSCAWVSDFSTDYETALKYCLNLGAHLYVSRSIERFNLLPHGQYFTIGLTDAGIEGTFVWQDNGEAISDTFQSLLFMNGEPDNYEDQEHCVLVKPGAIHNIATDYYCKRSTKFVCQRPVYENE